MGPEVKLAILKHGEQGEWVLAVGVLQLSYQSTGGNENKSLRQQLFRPTVIFYILIVSVQ